MRFFQAGFNYKRASSQQALNLIIEQTLEHSIHSFLIKTFFLLLFFFLFFSCFSSSVSCTVQHFFLAIGLFRCFATHITCYQLVLHAYTDNRKLIPFCTSLRPQVSRKLHSKSELTKIAKLFKKIFICLFSTNIIP